MMLLVVFNLSEVSRSPWNIDPTKIAATGGSAGACSSLWLAFHDDLCEPTSDDPVAQPIHTSLLRCSQ